ncbi:MAG: endonuclease MutS2 [Oscillospiraceae bacterium]|nr:endonuclease MutS2 [Oscillospiraceae bacterium]
MQDYTRHYKALELDKILGMLAEFAVSEDAKARALEITPAGTFADAVFGLALTGAANALSGRFGNPSIYSLRPCAQTVGKAKVGAALSLRELLDTAVILRCARGLISWKKQSDSQETPLDCIFSQLDSNQPLEDEIGRCILSDEEISDRASSELYDIRRKIRQAQLRAREQLDRMTRSSATNKFLQENIVTIRNGRFVVPVKAEHRNEIKGIVHDTSSSGATLFVEPASVVEQNNAIRELESAERHEIHRILLELSGRVGESADIILNNYDLIILLDVIFAKSRLADSMRGIQPELVREGGTRLVRARHPLIGQGKAVPIDISLGESFDTLVITGPNTGGKTVALKTLGLMTLMAMCGLMVPCGEGSRVCFYEKVLADIGDEQSIEQSLSTFSGHMTNIISILEQADRSSLVLMDELGAGTDPVEGAALAIAIIGELRGKGVKLAATTHYAEIKMFALQTEGVENGSCEFDVATLRPTYRLLIGVPGRSNAFAISERLGLPLSVIGAAKAQVSSENSRFEDVVAALEKTRQALEREKEAAAGLRRDADELLKKAREASARLEGQKEKELQRAREQARGLVEQVKFTSGRLIGELEELKKQKDRADFSSSVKDVKGTLRAYIDELEDKANPVTGAKKSEYRLPRALRRGDTVALADFGTNGTVLSAADDSGYVQVQAGIIKTKVHISSVRLLDEKKVTMDVKGTASARGVVSAAKQSVKTEVDLRGMDTNEAVLELERHIDNAILSGIQTVTAIHGKGTGALRDAVQARLRRHKSVKSFRAGVYGEGESGVTVVELR